MTFKNGRPVTTEPHDGVVLDKIDAVRVISDAFLGAANPPVLTSGPRTPLSAVRRAEANAKRRSPRPSR